jgi:hypothetical protein
MHRSGTSLVTRCLNLLGVFIGKKERLMPAEGGNNPVGFWEHLGIVGINQLILARLGGSWDDPPEFPSGWEDCPELADLYQQARWLVDEEFGGQTSWGFKDPRTCLTLPFWRRVVPAMRLIVCMRNPLDVASSLRARDGLTEEKSLSLWTEYTTAAMAHTASQERLVVFFEDYFRDWEKELGRLAKFLGQSMPTRDSQRYHEVEGVIKYELRHHESSVLDAMQKAGLDLPGQALCLAAWSLFPEDTPEKALSTGERRRVIDIFFRALQDYIHAPDYQKLRERLEDQAVRLRKLEAELAERDKQIEELVCSRSWKLTAPLRFLVERIRGFRSG